MRTFQKCSPGERRVGRSEEKRPGRDMSQASGGAANPQSSHGTTDRLPRTVDQSDSGFYLILATRTHAASLVSLPVRSLRLERVQRPGTERLCWCPRSSGTGWESLSDRRPDAVCHPAVTSTGRGGGHQSRDRNHGSEAAPEARSWASCAGRCAPSLPRTPKPRRHECFAMAQPPPQPRGAP